MIDGSRPATSLVHRRPGLLAVVTTVLVAAIAVPTAVLTAEPAPAAPPVPPPAPVVEAPAPPEVRDDVLGITFELPDGWTQQSGDLLFSLSSAASAELPGGGSALVGVGLLDEALTASDAPALPQVAQQLSDGFGEYFIPVPGRRVDPVEQATTVDGRAAWESGYRVVPDDPAADGGRVQVTAIEDGDRRLFVLSVAGPEDPELFAQARSAAATVRFD